MSEYFERKIYFYRIIPKDTVFKNYMQGRILDIQFKNRFQQFLKDPYEFLDANLPIGPPVIKERYSHGRDLLFIRDDPSKFNLIPWLGEHNNEGIITARIGYGKDRDLPTKIDMSGNETGIDLDKKRNEELYYPTHFVVFPNGIIGMERYRDGPMAYQLKYFLSKYLFGQASVIDLMEVHNREFIEELLKSPRIVSIYLKMAAIKYVHFLKHKKDMEEEVDDLLSNFLYLLVPDTIEIRASVDGRLKKKRLSKDAVVSLVEKLRGVDEELGIVENIVVRYEDPRTHELVERNIFEDKLIAKKKVVRAKEDWSRVDSEYMYNKIIEAYNELHDEIEKFLKETSNIH